MSKKSTGLEEPSTAYVAGADARTDGAEGALTITVSSHHAAWARERVDAGAFASQEDALRWALEHFIPSRDDGDDSWVQPYLDEARRDLDAGRLKSHEHVQAKLRGRIQRLSAKSAPQS